MEGIEIRVIQNLEEEWRYLIEPWCCYFRTEPTAAAVAAFRDPKNEEKLVEMLQEKVECDPDSLYILAWDTVNQKAAGMLLTAAVYHVMTPELEKTHQRTWANYNWDEETVDIIKNLEVFLVKMREESNVTEKYRVDKALLIDLTGVCTDYRKGGLAYRMTEVCLEEARRRGYPVIMSESTNFVTQKNKMERFGFEPVKEFDYAECYKNFHLLPEEIRKNNRKAVVLAKRL